MKTYFDMIRDISNLRWSIVDPDPTSFAEVQKCIKLAVAQANSFIWSLSDFPFRIRKENVTLKKGETAFEAPKGEILEMWCDGTRSYLRPIMARDSDFLSATVEGRPDRYWLECGDNGIEVHLFPKPDQAMTLNIRYSSDLRARDQSGQGKINLSEMDDLLNIPSDSALEELYLHCLYTKTMEYLIADTGDENYKPYQKEFSEAYLMLLKYTGSKTETRLTI